jgi:glycosyltransferase involved in cell wall biosynthesis
MYPPHSFGGYEQVWRSAVEHLRGRGHDVTVLTTDTRTATTAPDDPGVHRTLRWHLRGGEFERLDTRATVRLTRHNHRVLADHLRTIRPHVVSFWSMGGLTLTLLEAVRRRGVPAVAFVHDDWLDYGRRVDPWLRTLTGPRRRRLAPAAERLTGVPGRAELGAAAHYVFVSEHTRRHALRLGIGIPPERTSVAHSGIDPLFLDPAPERDWGWRLLYVGRLDPRKGVETAIEALARLPAEARLDLVGGWDDREEARLRDVAERLGAADRVRFVGHRDAPGVHAAYGEADAVVFPVVWEEPWGLVPLEAMGRARPVVATGRGGSAEYLRDGENALLFRAGDAGDLAAKLTRLGRDRALRRRLVAGGLELAPRHTEAELNEAVEAAVLAAADRAAPAPVAAGAAT